MDAGALRRQLQEDDDFLERRLRNGCGGTSRADVADVLLRMEQNIGGLRAQASAAPAEQRSALSAHCEAFGRRLKQHRDTLQRATDEASRSALLQSGRDEGTEKKKPAINSEEEAQSAEVAALTQVRERTKHVFGHMTSTLEGLNVSSKSIGKTRDQMGEFERRMDSASKALGQLKKRTEEDSKYIWWSFYFFCSVVTYIVLRRMKVFRMIYYGASWTWWSGATATSLLHGTATQFAELYQRIGAFLGISGDFETKLA